MGLFGNILGGALSFIPGGSLVSGIVSGGGGLKNVLKKKEGGTVMGNLLRRVTGKTKQQVKESAADLKSKIGKSVGDEIGSTVHSVSMSDLGIAEGSVDSEAVKSAKKSFLTSVWKENKGLILGLGAGLIALFIAMFFMGKKSKK